MGIELVDEQLELALDDALAAARSSDPLPQLWLQRVRRLGDLGIKTYVAALGGAMVAKASDVRVDVLTQDVAAGSRAYSLRKAAEFLAANNRGRFHMGTKSKNPMNNRPFLGGPGRIDEFTKIKPNAKPSFDLYCDCLSDLNRLDADGARQAFAAWMRVRMEVLTEEAAVREADRALTTGLRAAALVALVERFVREDPEGGRRGQALVAAVLDCAYDDVELQPINDPKPGDVRVKVGGALRLIAEVKQAPCDEHTATQLAADAATLNVSLALLAVMADRHQPLDREQARRHALQHHDVLLEVTESARELIGTLAVMTSTPVEHVVKTLPGAYAARLREHQVADATVARWTDLVAAQEDH